jgi:galactokinase
LLSDERVLRLGHAFREHTGRAPQGGWSAPGRVNLIGEHTDYNDGLALPFAIDRLSSSAALECVVALALNELANGGLDRMQLAEACQSAENTEVGAQTGMMDQVASLFGHAGSMLLFDVRSRQVTPLPAVLDGLVLLVIDTAVRHSNAGAGYTARRSECAEAAQLMGVSSLREADLGQVADLASKEGHEGLLGRRVRHVFTENVRVSRAAALLRAGRSRDLGSLLNASHVSLRDDFEVSAPELDVAVDAATEAGALGARMVGGGFGGSVLVLAGQDDVPAVLAGVNNAYAKLDWPEPVIFPVTPSEGARRFR